MGAGQSSDSSPRIVEVDRSSPGVTEVDNPEWVRKHAANLDINNIQQVFSYVRVVHPLAGCSRRAFPDLCGDESVEELAKLADAVTVACVNSGEEISVPPGFDYNSLNHTALGNIAFTALYASQESWKAKCLTILESWRAARKTKLSATSLPDPNSLDIMRATVALVSPPISVSPVDQDMTPRKE